MTNTRTDIIDNGQSANTMTRLDPERINRPRNKNQQLNSQQEFLLTTIQKDFLWDLCDNMGKHIFSRTFMLAQGIVSTTTPVLFISQRLIHFHPPYGMVFHSHVHWLIEHIVRLIFNTSVYGYEKP